MIRPWHRSRLFWLGLPGLLFLLWAWRSSNLTCYQLTLGSWELNSTQGKVLAWSMQSDSEHDFHLDYRTAEVFTEWIAPNTRTKVRRIVPMAAAYPIPPGEQCWFAAAKWQAADLNADTYHRLLVLPYWLLAGGCAVAWIGVMVAWQRRKARLVKASAAPLP
jgi:hypothetical protein